jgi:SAM-dependent methyltransferase
MQSGAGDPSHWSSAEAAEAWQQGEARRAQMYGTLTERLLDLAEIRVGLRVLDVAAGTGEQTLAAARRVGPTGRVLATDLSASMLETAAQAARNAGLTNVETAVLDARDLGVEPASFDGAICRNGLQWIPQPERALASIHAALRPGARLAVLVHGAPERNVFMTLPTTIIRRIGSLPEPSPSEPDNFALGGAGALEAAYRAAGFREVVVQPVPIDRRFASATEAATALREAGGHLRTMMAALTPAQCDQIWTEVAAAYQQFAGPDGVDLTSESLLAVGTR